MGKPTQVMLSGLNVGPEARVPGSLESFRVQGFRV